MTEVTEFINTRRAGWWGGPYNRWCTPTGTLQRLPAINDKKKGRHRETPPLSQPRPDCSVPRRLQRRQEQQQIVALSRGGAVERRRRRRALTGVRADRRRAVAGAPV